MRFSNTSTLLLLSATALASHWISPVSARTMIRRGNFVKDEWTSLDQVSERSMRSLEEQEGGSEDGEEDREEEDREEEEEEEQDREEEEEEEDREEEEEEEEDREEEDADDEEEEGSGDGEEEDADEEEGSGDGEEDEQDDEGNGQNSGYIAATHCSSYKIQEPEDDTVEFVLKWNAVYGNGLDVFRVAQKSYVFYEYVDSSSNGNNGNSDTLQSASTYVTDLDSWLQTTATLGLGEDAGPSCQQIENAQEVFQTKNDANDDISMYFASANSQYNNYFGDWEPQLYVGPICGMGDNVLNWGIFLDDTCTTYVPKWTYRYRTALAKGQISYSSDEKTLFKVSSLQYHWSCGKGDGFCDTLLSNSADTLYCESPEVDQDQHDEDEQSEDEQNEDEHGEDRLRRLSEDEGEDNNEEGNSGDDGDSNDNGEDNGNSQDEGDEDDNGEDNGNSQDEGDEDDNDEENENSKDDEDDNGSGDGNDSNDVDDANDAGDDYYDTDDYFVNGYQISQEDMENIETECEGLMASYLNGEGTLEGYLKKHGQLVQKTKDYRKQTKSIVEITVLTLLLFGIVVISTMMVRRRRKRRKNDGDANISAGTSTSASAKTVKWKNNGKSHSKNESHPDDEKTIETASPEEPSDTKGSLQGSTITISKKEEVSSSKYVKRGWLSALQAKKTKKNNSAHGDKQKHLLGSF